MKIQKVLLTSSLVAVLGTGLVACSSTPSSGTYDRTQAGTLQEVKYGTVTGVRNVLIENEETGVGTATGGIIGGIAGSHAGKGSGRAVGAVLGSVLGGVVGSKIDKNVQTKPGIEVTIRLQDGNTVAISQLADERFNVGDRVKVITNNGRARVTH